MSAQFTWWLCRHPLAVAVEESGRHVAKEVLGQAEVADLSEFSNFGEDRFETERTGIGFQGLQGRAAEVASIVAGVLLDHV